MFYKSSFYYSWDNPIRFKYDPIFQVMLFPKQYTLDENWLWEMIPAMTPRSLVLGVARPSSDIEEPGTSLTLWAVSWGVAPPFTPGKWRELAMDSFRERHVEMKSLEKFSLLLSWVKTWLRPRSSKSGKERPALDQPLPGLIGFMQACGS